MMPGAAQVQQADLLEGQGDRPQDRQRSPSIEDDARRWARSGGSPVRRSSRAASGPRRAWAGRGDVCGGCTASRRSRGSGPARDGHGTPAAASIAVVASLAASSRGVCRCETSFTALATGCSPWMAPSRSPWPCGMAQRCRLCGTAGERVDDVRRCRTSTAAPCCPRRHPSSPRRRSTSVGPGVVPVADRDLALRGDARSRARSRRTSCTRRTSSTGRRPRPPRSSRT